MLSGMTFVKKYSPNASEKGFLMKPQSSRTLTSSLSPVQLKNTRALSMYLRLASRAKGTVLPVKGSAKKTRATSGRKRLQSFVMYDLDTHSWKTSQVCFQLTEAQCSRKFSQTWPKSGSMQNGLVSEQTIVAHRTEEKDSGYWPTPTIHGNYNRKGASKKSGDGLETAVKMWPIEEKEKASGGQLNPMWVSWLMGWPIGWVDLEPMDEMVWLPFDPEPNIPRVTTGEKDRAKKLKALGNGQVPQCAALAWKILHDSI